MADDQLYCAVLRFELDGATRITFGRQLRPKLVSPLQHDPSRTVELDNFPSVGDPPIGKDQLPSRPYPPVGLEVHSKPIFLHEFRGGESSPQLFRRCPDVCHVDETTVPISHGLFRPSFASSRPMPRGASA